MPAPKTKEPDLPSGDPAPAMSVRSPARRRRAGQDPDQCGDASAADAAFRSAHMALSGIGIPATDGIVGRDGETSLANLGRLAQEGMAQVDASILAIMQAKLETQDQPSGY